MALISLGDMAQAFLLRRQNVALKTDQQRLSTELASGAAADTAQHLSGDLAPLAAITTSLARLDGYRTATTEAAGRLTALQATLGHVGNLSSGLASTVLAAGSAGSVDAAAAESRATLDAVLAAFNGRHAGRSLFAGVSGDGPAVTDAETMLAALETATAGAATPDALDAAVAAWFGPAGGYATTGYLGGDDLAPLAIAPGETVAVAATARDDGVTDTLIGLALAALIDRGALAGSDSARAAGMRRAGERLLESGHTRAAFAARIGLAEGRIEQAAVRNTAEESALEIARTAMLAVDSYETAVRLEVTQTQLETLYSITARITRLSLVDYLR